MAAARGRGAAPPTSLQPGGVTIALVVDPADAGWLALRIALWPGGPVSEHRQEMVATLAAPERFGVWLARHPSLGPCGFAEGSVRTDYVNGTDSTPVAFLEGLYVSPWARRQGIARQLVDAVAAWGRARGCSELASDTQLTNEASQVMHRHLGFAETERVVYYRKALT